MRTTTTPFLRLAAAAGAALLTAAAHAGSLDVNNGAACEGSFGLEVTPGSLCLFDTESTLGGGGLITGTHGACAFLFADDTTTAGATTFVAGHQIALGEDFTAANDFTAELSPAISPLAFVADNRPSGETTYRASFQLDLDNLTLDTNDLIRHLVGLSADGRRWFQLRLERSQLPPENRLLLEALEDDGTSVVTPFGQQLLIPPGCRTIEVDWVAAPGAGHLLVALDGAGFVGLTGLANGAGRIDRVEWGAAGGQLQSLSGSLSQDDFASSR